MKFFFTYGRKGQPFRGGWTEVQADCLSEACAAFRAYHPDKSPKTLNCSSVYSEEDFNEILAGPDGEAFGRCHEVITIRREAEMKGETQ